METYHEMIAEREADCEKLQTTNEILLEATEAALICLTEGPHMDFTLETIQKLRAAIKAAEAPPA